MTHRHYGLTPAKRDLTRETPCTGVAGVVVILIVLLAVLHGMIKAVTEAENGTQSTPLAQGAAASIGPSGTRP